jgi:hypothetical protein
VVAVVVGVAMCDEGVKSSWLDVRTAPLITACSLCVLCRPSTHTLSGSRKL